MTKIKINDIELLVSSKIKDYGVKFPNNDDKDDQTLHNMFIIIFELNKKRASFRYYGSHNDYIKGYDVMSDKDNLFAARAIFEDALYSMDSFNNFCSNLGYSNDSIRAHKIYLECLRSKQKLNHIGFNDEDMYKAIETFSEHGIE